MQDNRNFILAIIITMGILFGWEYFYNSPQRLKEEQTQAELASTGTPNKDAGVPQMSSETINTDGIPGMATSPAETIPVSRDEVLKSRTNVVIDSPRLLGTINLKGLRFDDISLKGYRQTVDKNSDIVKLLNPADVFEAYFAEFGWIGEGKKPDGNSVWTSDSFILSSERAVNFTWDNGEGLIFQRTVSIDKDFMFTVKQGIQNNSEQSFTMAPFGRVYREGGVEQGLFILHEGPLRVGDEGKEEYSFSDLKDDKVEEQKATTGGWVGITDAYWLVALVPDQGKEFYTNILYTQHQNGEQFHVNYKTNGMVLAAGGTIENTVRFFAGAKQVDILDHYTEDEGIKMFDYAIDWGWFHFLTKPIYIGLEFFYDLVGNFGIAILLLTVVIKAILFPMANKQYESMGRMKKLQPKMQTLKEKFGDDRAKMQQETMKLYKDEKVNPLASCLPIFIQIPIFFSLYKVLYVTIDMRHAPFFGWIRDLSAPDSMLVTNLFGLIPWEPTGFLAIGILPVLMGVTMYGQQKLNPPMADPIQQKVFNLMPIMFTFILAGFSVGLVIYWTWNNILTICQQWYIMRRVAAKDNA
ncbi:MAG: membrane protein insertase YidC [Proteobacteria bacterium]|nr:membrane protein insertase YidC [Pseudomonadota bacterium]